MACCIPCSDCPAAEFAEENCEVCTKPTFCAGYTKHKSDLIITFTTILKTQIQYHDHIYNNNQPQIQYHDHIHNNNQTQIQYHNNIHNNNQTKIRYHNHIYNNNHTQNLEANFTNYNAKHNLEANFTNYNTKHKILNQILQITKRNIKKSKTLSHKQTRFNAKKKKKQIFIPLLTG